MRSSPAKLFLSQHAFVCVAQNHVIFLDLRSDKYSALGEDQVAALSGTIAGWPPTGTTVSSCACSTRNDVLAELLREGLITSDKLAGKPADSVYLRAATGCLRGPIPQCDSVRLVDLPRFFVAWATIALTLHTVSLERTVERIRRRKAERADTAETNLDALRPALASYFKLQSRFLPLNDSCLRNSLTMVEYLASYNFYPTCVFGVHMQPWSAHCWVQDRNIVLGDTITNTREFVPIMTI